MEAPIANMGWYKQTKRDFAELAAGSIGQAGAVRVSPRSSPHDLPRSSREEFNRRRPFPKTRDLVDLSRPEPPPPVPTSTCTPHTAPPPLPRASVATKHPASAVIVICPPSSANRASMPRPAPHAVHRRVQAGRRREDEGDHVGGVGADHGVGCRCHVTEPKADPRISPPVVRPKRPSAESSDDQPRMPGDIGDGARGAAGLRRRQQHAAGSQHTGELPAARRGSGT